MYHLFEYHTDQDQLVYVVLLEEIVGTKIEIIKAKTVNKPLSITVHNPSEI
jgi:hypothetical protein